MKKLSPDSKDLIVEWAQKGAAIKNHGRMCDDCAFKKGTRANASKITTTQAAELLAYDLPGLFMCHLDNGEDEDICIGYLHAKEYCDSKNNGN